MKWPFTSWAGLSEEVRVIFIPIKTVISKFAFPIRSAMIKREHKLKEIPSNNFLNRRPIKCERASP